MKIISIFLGVLIANTAYSSQQEIQAISANTQQPHSEHKVRPNTVLYKISANINPQQLKSLNALLNSQGLVSSRTLQGSQLVIGSFNHAGREKAIANILKRSSLVEFAEPDYVIEPTAEPNDPNWGNQWHHNNVNSLQAWDITTGNKSVLTAVCDSGFDATHPDLADNLRLDLAFNAQDGSDYIFDADGHGTGTAGTLGAVGNNATGVAGMNWDVDIIPIRIAISDTNSSAYISTMVTCIEYAADKGARVVNLSYGGIQYASIDAAAQYLRSKNGLLFMSAGNGGQEYNFPDYVSFVGVGATDENNNRASFSSWGDYVDITAPGVRILTTYPSNRYVYYSGTSFSSPLTAGIAALMVAANSNITPAEIENGLFTTTTDIGSTGNDKVFGHGLVNAQAAVEYASNLGSSTAPIAEITVSSQSVPFGTAIDFSGSNSFDSDGTVVLYSWNLGDGTTSEQVNLTHTYGQAGMYPVTLKVTDNDGLSNSASINIQVTTDVPVAVIDNMTQSYQKDESISFNGLGSYDNDGSIVKYEWTFGDGSLAVGGVTEHSFSEVGTYKVLLTVTDNAGAMNTASIDIFITDPYALIAPDGVNGIADGFKVELSWNDTNDNEEAYIVERGTKFRGKIRYSSIATVAANVSSYTDMLDETGDYNYRIKAVNQFDEAISSPIKVTVDGNGTNPDPGNLPAPSNLVATLNGDMVTLSWNDNSNTENGFYIERGKKQKGRVNFARIAQVSEGVITYQDNVSRLNGNYVYRVQAFNTDDVSAYSNTAELRLK